MKLIVSLHLTSAKQVRLVDSAAACFLYASGAEG